LSQGKIQIFIFAEMIIEGGGGDSQPHSSDTQQNPSTTMNTIFEFRYWTLTSQDKVPALSENTPLTVFYHAGQRHRRILTSKHSLHR
jgi:hypothetical protein